MSLKKVDLKELTPEIFSIFATNKALLTVGNRDSCNTMTIGWCGLGNMWNLPSCTIHVRPERHTFDFMEKYDYFTVSVLPLELYDKIMFCGTHSGRDVDKFKECGFTLQYGMGDAPFIEQSEWIIVCRKRYAQDLVAESVIDERVFKFYEKENWHRMYIGEVKELYMK